jgi:hypothetical protein
MATVYEYQGLSYQLPDGLSNEAALTRIKASLGGGAAQTPAPAPQAEVSTMERMFGAGSPIARTIKGAVVDPALAVNQLLASTGLFGQDIKQGATQLVSDVEATTQQGRARVGSEGFDPYQLVGNVISPVNRLVGGAQALQAPGLAAAATRSAGTGAALGALAPVNAPVDQFAEKKLEQMTLGAVLGPVLEGGVNALGAFAGLFKGFTAQGRQDVLREQLNTLAGPERNRVIEALRDAKELVTGSRPTVADAIADIPSAVELSAAQRKLASQTGVAGKFAERTVERQAARVRALNDIAGTEADRVALAAERGAVTGPMRETALNQANVAGPIFTKLEKEIANKFNSLAASEQTAGMTGLAAQTQQAAAEAGRPGWLSAGDIAADAAKRAKSYNDLSNVLRGEAQLKQFQLNSLEQNGFFPLRATDVTDELDKAIRGTVSDQSKAVLQAVKDKVIGKADENGLLNSRDLYENVRKISNQDIAKLLGLGEQYASGGLPQQAASALSNVKKLVDASLNKSSDGLWSKYLTSYSDYSKKLDRMEVGDYLSKRLQTPLDKERAGVFATAVENAAGTIKKSTGIPRFDKLSDVLTLKEIGTVNNVLADLSRTTKADELARMVRNVETGLPDTAQASPNFLNKYVTLGKAAFGYLQRGNAKAFNEQMAEMMLDPAAMAQFLSFAIPKSRVNETTSAMMKLMNDPTRAAFTQVFLIPAIASEVGAQQQE